MYRLKELLFKVGKNQLWLADRLGMSKTSVNNWINGRNKPTFNTMKQIQELLNEECDRQGRERMSLLDAIEL